MKNKRDKSHYLLIQINYIHCNKVQRNKVSTYSNYTRLKGTLQRLNNYFGGRQYREVFEENREGASTLPDYTLRDIYGPPHAQDSPEGIFSQDAASVHSLISSRSLVAPL